MDNKSQIPNLKSRIANERESGIATIMAIGVAAMLLMLAIAFVTTSMIERKAAFNYQSLNVARAMAQTAFNRAMANMKLKSINSNESMNEIASHDNSIGNNSDANTRLIYGDGLASELTTIINGDTYFEIPSDYPTNTQYNITDTAAITWIYLKTNDLDTNNAVTNSQIIGRIAYVVLPDKGKIDPWAVVDSGYNAYLDSDTTPASEITYGSSKANATSVSPSGNYVFGRPGRDITELCLASLENDADTFYASYTQKMSTKRSAVSSSGNINSNTLGIDTGIAGDWKDFEQLFNKLGISSSNDTIRQYFKEVFYLNAPADEEKYWVDNNLDSIRDSGEMQNRFNLSRTDWDNLTVANFGVKAPELKWLLNMNDTQKRDQIIANLIDYCDADDVPDSSGGDTPTYLGLEKVPYINEVMIQFNATITRSGDNTLSNPYRYKFYVKPTIAVELINIYDGMTARPYKLYIEPNIVVNYYYGKDTYAYSSSKSTDTAVFSIDVPSNNAKDYLPILKYEELPIELNDTITKTSNADLDVNNVKALKIKIQITINGLKAKLLSQNGLTLYDYSVLPNLSTQKEFFASNGNNNVTHTAYFTIDCQVSDPRQNHNPADWNNFTVGSPDASQSTSESSASVTIRATNTAYTTAKSGFGSATADIETASDPQNISTAYIRNAPMKSPWELGFIHRAAAFQTLNLKKYNTVTNGDGFGPGACAEDYSDGDANILDQIKMTSNSTTQGKINVNTDNKSVLRTLFDQIKVGSSKNDPGSGGTAVSTVKANTIADAVLNKNGKNGGSPFYTRAEIVNSVTELSDDTIMTNQDDDATKEEIIGKFINLTKAETPNEYVVIAVGQAIKDIKGSKFDKHGNPLPDNGISSHGTYEKDVDEILASQKIFATIKRKINAGTGSDTFYIQNLMYLEQ